MAEAKKKIIKPPDKNKVPGALYRTQIGRGGFKWSYPGYVYEEFLIQLIGAEGVRTYREMSENDAIVGSCLYAIKQVLREIRWGVKKPEGGRQEDADFLEANMKGMVHTWSDVMSNVYSMFTYGWSWFEQIYTMRDGHAVWKKLGHRAQGSLERWELRDNGEVIGMWQRSEPDMKLVFIPAVKSILFRTEDRSGSPEGHSILRNAYRAWYFKKNFEELEGIGIERDLVGIPTLEMPEGMKIDEEDTETATAIKWAQDILTNIRQDEQAGVLIPHGWVFSLVSSPGKKQIDVSKSIDRLSREIAISVLAQFIMLGMERTGSYALSKALIDLFFVSLEGFANYIATTFNRQAVTTLFRLNGVIDRPLPYIAHTPVRRESLKDLASFLSLLQPINAIEIDEDLKTYLKSYAKLSQFSDAKM